MCLAGGSSGLQVYKQWGEFLFQLFRTLLVGVQHKSLVAHGYSIPSRTQLVSLLTKQTNHMPHLRGNHLDWPEDWFHKHPQCFQVNPCKKHPAEIHLQPMNKDSLWKRHWLLEYTTNKHTNGKNSYNNRTHVLLLLVDDVLHRLLLLLRLHIKAVLMHVEAVWIIGYTMIIDTCNITLT